MLDFLQNPFRPDRTKWKPHANSGDCDRDAAYREAAKRLGMKIKLSYPVPCSAGADYCARLGMKGVYILREDEAKEDKFSDEFFKCLFEINR